MKIELLKTHGLFFLILVLCLILRFIPLFDYQFTLDELSGLSRTNFPSLGDLMEKGVKIDAHPALIQVLLFYLTRLFGFANWLIKLPFLLMSVGAVVYAYVFSLHNFSKQTGIFSALILSFSLIFVFYAPIARMYIAGAFFSMALVYYFFEIFFVKQTKGSNYFFLGLFALLSAFNQHLNALFAFTLCASGLFVMDKSTATKYLITCLVTVLCYLPHLPVTLYQLGIGGIGLGQNGWLPVPEKWALFDFLKVLLGTGKTYVLFALLVGLSVLLKKKLVLNKKQIVLLLLFLVNYTIIYCYSVFRAPIFQNSALLFSSVAFVVFLASLMNYGNKYVFYGATLVVCIALLFKTYVKKDYFHQAVKTVFEYQFERTAYYKSVHGDHAVQPLFFDADEFMKTLYFKKYNLQFDCHIFQDSLPPFKQFTHLVAALQCDYLVMASSFPIHQAVALEYFPYLIENTQTQGINYKVYSRRLADKKNTVKDDAVIKQSDPETQGDFKYSKINSRTMPRTSFLFPVNRSDEFPFDAQAKYRDVVSAEGQMLLVKAKFKTRGTPFSGKAATCISVTDPSSHQLFGYASEDMEDFITFPDSSVTVYVNDFIGTTHKKTSDSTKLTMYVWNKGKDEMMLTNFEIKLIDYWHQKWHFWD